MKLKVQNVFNNEIQNGFLKAIDVVKYLISTCGMKTEKEIQNTSLSDLYYEIANKKHFVKLAYIDTLEGNFCIEFI